MIVFVPCFVGAWDPQYFTPPELSVNDVKEYRDACFVQSVSGVVLSNFLKLFILGFFLSFFFFSPLYKEKKKHLLVISLLVPILMIVFLLNEAYISVFVGEWYPFFGIQRIFPFLCCIIAAFFFFRSRQTEAKPKTKSFFFALLRFAVLVFLLFEIGNARNDDGKSVMDMADIVHECASQEYRAIHCNKCSNPHNFIPEKCGNISCIRL